MNVKARQYDYVTLYKYVLVPLPTSRPLPYHSSIFRSPGTYELVLKHGGGLETLAEWEVKPLADCKKAKNVRSRPFRPLPPRPFLTALLLLQVILFVGDGMAPSMVRLLLSFVLDVRETDLVISRLPPLACLDTSRSTVATSRSSCSIRARLLACK